MAHLVPVRLYASGNELLVNADRVRRLATAADGGTLLEMADGAAYRIRGTADDFRAAVLAG
jgi:hypothetical protein